MFIFNIYYFKIRIRRGDMLVRDKKWEEDPSDLKND